MLSLQLRGAIATVHSKSRITHRQVASMEIRSRSLAYGGVPADVDEYAGITAHGPSARYVSILHRSLPGRDGAAHTNGSGLRPGLGCHILLYRYGQPGSRAAATSQVAALSAVGVLVVDSAELARTSSVGLSVRWLLNCDLGWSLTRNEPAAHTRRAFGHEGHQRPAFCSQFAHAHETPFCGPFANQRAVFEVDLPKLCPKHGSVAGVHSVFLPFVSPASV